MASDDDSWARAWNEVRTSYAADAPRRAAGQAAFKAVRPLKGRPVMEVRAALVNEMAACGITDLSDAQLDVLVQAVVASPTRAAVNVVRSQLRVFAGIWQEMKKSAAPRWTESPSKVPAYPWREDQDVYRAVVQPQPGTDELWQRIYDEVPIMSDTDEPELRALQCWVSLDSTQDPDRARAIVRTGTQVLGTLSAKDSQRLQTVLKTMNSDSVSLDGAAWGTTPATCTITVGLPDRS